jgi:hypothetical protein
MASFFPFAIAAVAVLVAERFGVSRQSVHD